MGLDEPEQKMSKSAPGPNHAIGLLDDPKTVQKKIARATTDSLPSVDLANMGPGVANLITIAQACDSSLARDSFVGLRYGDLKKRVTEAVLSRLEPIQQKYREITAERAYIDSVLAEGRDRVMPIADDTVRKTKAAMGLYV
jgi:tryptophanyl-tRNA synthetase